MNKAIKIACKGVEYVDYLNLVDFQGNLKDLSVESYGKLKNEIIERGFSFAIHVWKNDGRYYILDGHQRVRTIKTMVEKEGWACADLPVVPVEAASIHEAKLKLLGATSQYGEMTNQGLYEYMNKSDIKIDEIVKNFDLPNIDIEQFKEEFFGDGPKPEESGEEDKVPTIEKIKRCKLSEKYILGQHRLMCGDSTDSSHVQRLMVADKAQLLFTDPPYGMSYGGGRKPGDDVLDKKTGGVKIKAHGEILGDDKRGDDLIKMVGSAINMAQKFMDPLAASYICFTWRTYQEFLAALAVSDLKASACIVWDKKSIGLGLQDYRPQHEFIFYCGGKWHGDKAQGDIWQMSRGNTSDYVHPTQKPVELIERAIKNSSLQGDVVIDLFGGSGSTLIAAEKTQRAARLMELDPHYCDVILERWAQFTGKDPIRESDQVPWSEIKRQRTKETKVKERKTDK